MRADRAGSYLFVERPEVVLNLVLGRHFDVLNSVELCAFVRGAEGGRGLRRNVVIT